MNALVHHTQWVGKQCVAPAADVYTFLLRMPLFIEDLESISYNSWVANKSPKRRIDQLTGVSINQYNSLQSELYVRQGIVYTLRTACRQREKATAVC